MIFKKNSLNKITVEIEGLCCARCGEKVESWLNMLDGVSADVNFKKGKAVLRCVETVPADEKIRETIEQNGVYKVRSITHT
ncbi:MAG: heavy-metal-associated domain-containing protein [Clostridia bacterium]|nr:heavy-metal-associated domain-containing protein [Clostridia bacterium]